MTIGMKTFLLPSHLKSFLWDICFKKTAHLLNILLCLSQWLQWLSSKSPLTSCCGWRNWWNSLEPLKCHKGTPKGQSVIFCTAFAENDHDQCQEDQSCWDVSRLVCTPYVFHAWPLRPGLRRACVIKPLLDFQSSVLFAHVLENTSYNMGKWFLWQIHILISQHERTL